MVLRKYFNDRADIWDAEVTENDSGKLQRMAERLGLESGSRVLDVGTGTGIFLPYIKRIIGASGSIVAMDIAEEMLRKAQAKNPDGRISYLQADVMVIPLGDGLFDSVVCYSSFPHFQDKPKALGEIKRVLRNGGKVVICHTSSRDHINEIHSQLPEVKDDLLPDVSDMHLMLSSAGFGGIQVEEDSESYLAVGVKA